MTAVIQNVLVLPTFFDFFTYLPRLLMLAVSCGDFFHVRQMLEALEKILDQLDACECSIKPRQKRNTLTLRRFQRNLEIVIKESFECAFPLKLKRREKALWTEHFGEAHKLYPTLSFRDVQARHQQYLKQDLAHAPLKLCLLPPVLSGRIRSPIARKELTNFDFSAASDLLNGVILKGCGLAMKLAKVPSIGGIPSGLLFPTRPLDIQDLYILHDTPFSQEGANEIADCLLAMRGFKPEGSLPVYKDGKPDHPIEIPCEGTSRDSIRIAVTSWKTHIKSWNASISRHQDPDPSRLDRLNRLLTNVIECRERPNYLILPELSIPANWFLAVARKLQGAGISLICGIEYLHAKKGTVHNQVWGGVVS